MASILLVGHDYESLVAPLRYASHDVMLLSRGLDAIRLSIAFGPSVLVIDAVLSDVTGIEVLRCLPDSLRSVAYLAVSTAGPKTTSEAVRLGAEHYVKKPIVINFLLSTLARLAAVQSEPIPRCSAPRISEPYAFVRLAQKAAQFAQSSRDISTLSELGRAVGVSSGTLRNWCRTARIGARSYRQFVRALRATYQYERDQSVGVENLVDIVDRRTLRSFVLASGGDGNALPRSVAEFLEHQRFLHDPDAIAAVRSLVGLDCGQSARAATSVGRAGPRHLLDS